MLDAFHGWKPRRLSPLFVKVTGANDLFFQRSGTILNWIDLHDGPIAPSWKKQIVQLRQLRLAEGMAAIEHQVMLFAPRQRVGNDEGRNVIARRKFPPP